MYLKLLITLLNSSGSSNLILKSILLSIAASKSYFLLVAAINKTSVVLSKLSIFLNNVDKILLLASCIPSPLLVAIESISSINNIA
jgi:hypothetical protein